MSVCWMFICSLIIHSSIHSRPLLEVGIVRKGIDVLLDDFVAELVLFLRENNREQGELCSVAQLKGSILVYDSTVITSPEGKVLTSVCTMWGLCSLRLLTVWKTSRMPSAFTLSRTVLSAQKVPVRPAPALKIHTVKRTHAFFITLNAVTMCTVTVG